MSGHLLFQQTQGPNGSIGFLPEQPQNMDLSSLRSTADILVLFVAFALVFTTIVVFIRSKPALTKRIALLTQHLEDYKALLPDCKVAVMTTCTQALIADTEKEIQWLTKILGEGVEKRGPFYFVYWVRMWSGKDTYEQKWKKGGEGWKVDGGKQGGLEKGVERSPDVLHASEEEDFEWVAEKYDA